MAGTSSSLASLFSDKSKVNFARVNKPKEIKSKKRSAEEVTGGEGGREGGELTPKRVKKPKHKHSKRLELSERITESQTDTSTGLTNLSVGEESEERERDEKEKKDQRTIFVGNIPITATITSLKTFFQEFGPVDSVRLRSVPIAGTAVDVKGDQNLVRKVCINQGKFGDQKGSCNAYVVFKNKESVERSLAANNRVMGERHLRVDRLNPTLFNPKTSVFLGGLPFYTDEEELRQHFAKILPNGQDDISGIRLVRNPETLVGKGIGYFALRNHEAVIKALTLDQSKFKKKLIRVTSCGKRTKKTEERKKIVSTLLPTPSGENTTTPNSDATVKVSKKRKRSKLEASSPAVRRMQMKKAIAQIAKKNAQQNPNKKT